MEGSGAPRFAVPSRIDPERLSRALPAVFGATVLAILAAKLALTWRININWDEFFYLSHVHALERGELSLLLQGAYTHLFRWIAATGGNEIDQILLLRVAMWMLLVLSAWLLYRLARCFSTPAAAAFAVLAFAGSWPVLKHGASFRADAMLLPLTLATLWLVLRDAGRRRANDVAAGLCLGAAFALSTKAVLMLPVLGMLVVLTDDGMPGAASRIGVAARRLSFILPSAALLSAVVIAAHATQVMDGTEAAGHFAARTIAATLIDVPFLPRGDYFSRLVVEDPVYWAALLAGLLVAVRLHTYRAAACALALLPILFYRNAFPYYYPLMMAPAAVLVALAADGMLGRTTAARRPVLRRLALAALGLAVMHGAWDGIMALRFDEQQKQKRVIAAVHSIFPQPVPYLDHSGMIATYPKANFLMSSWGVESYRRADGDFMPGLLATKRPPLLLVNHSVLQPGTLLYRQLSPVDRGLLAASYVDYWGPIRVAGAAFRLPAAGSIVVHVPFDGRYRVEAPAPFTLEGRLVTNREVLELAGAVDLTAVAGASGALDARLVWADARDPPAERPPAMPLYVPL